MKVNTSFLFKKAYGRFCIPAINVSNPEQVNALFRAAQKMQAPFIIQTSPAARTYIHPMMLTGYIRSAAALYPKVLFALHLDHGDEAHAQNAIAATDYTSVMIDASHKPLLQNIATTRKIVAAAHLKDISVEAELGVLSGIEDAINISDSEALYTNPDDVVHFVRETHCDSLAVAVGTSHGPYKFAHKGTLRFDILEKIQQQLPGFPIVLHGASAINEEEVQRINRAGGALRPDTKGLNAEEVRKAIQYGVCKLNIATDLRLLWNRVFREYFRDYPEEWDHLKPGLQYMKELEDLIAEKFTLLNVIDTLKLYVSPLRV